MDRSATPMIVTVTDFGLKGPYVGQMQAVLHLSAPNIPIVSLFADAPMFNPRATAYLLAAYATAFPMHCVFLCVVDPGVGSWKHRPVVVRANDRWYVGPDNGLFSVLARRSNGQSQVWPITWRPERLSTSFHGRDLYAPTAARLAVGDVDLGTGNSYESADGVDWPDDLAEVVYIDHYGNAITGIRSCKLDGSAVIELNGVLLCQAECFSKIPQHHGCWYANSNGLVEIAVNCGRADDVLGINIGTVVKVHAGPKPAQPPSIVPN